MAQTPPPPLDELPEAPSTSRLNTFDLLMDTFLAALVVFRTQLVAAISNVYNNAVDAFNSATAAAGSAAAAAAAVNATRFVSGFNYAQDAAAISAIDFYTYRRKIAGSGTIDPANDPSNWVLMNAAPTPIAAYQNAVVLDTTGPFVPTVTGWHEITLFGAAGSGGVASVMGSGAKVATGGGAGGVCRATRWLVAGQTYMFNAGAGASARGNNPGGANGVDGGVTTFSGPNIPTMTANGGKAGKFAAAGPLLGGDGGTATGGDVNYTGGRGGNITGTGTGLAATGGGAVSLFGVARNGGDITHTSANVASGGASPGGNGGAITSTAGPATSGGGGMGGAAAAVSTATSGTGGKAGVTNAPNLLLANGGGTPGTVSAGSGTGGVATPSSGNSAASAGTFAGSGGTVVTDNTTSLANAATAAGGDFGGGSGGMVYQTGGSFTLGGATSGGRALIRF